MPKKSDKQKKRKLLFSLRFVYKVFGMGPRTNVPVDLPSGRRYLRVVASGRLRPVRSSIEFANNIFVNNVRCYEI